MCVKNKWSKKIINEVFEDIKNQQNKLIGQKRRVITNQRYNVVNRFNIKR